MLARLDRVWMLRALFVISALWMFSLGYVTAIGFSRGLGWSIYQVTLFFPEGGITGDQFVALFAFMRYVAVLLTASMVILWGLFEVKRNEEVDEDVTDA